MTDTAVKANTVEELINLLGGLSKFSRDIKANPSTTSHWKSTGVIPYWRKEKVKQVARRNSVVCSKELFSDG